VAFHRRVVCEAFGLLLPFALAACSGELERRAAEERPVLDAARARLVALEAE